MQTKSSQTKNLAASILLAAGAVAFSPLVTGADVATPSNDAMPVLFGAPSNARMTVKAVNTGADRTAVRERAVAVDTAQIAPATKVSRIGVQLFNGDVVPLDLTVLEQRGDNSFTYVGKVRGSEKSQAVLTVVDGRLAGSVTMVDEATQTTTNYVIVPNADGSTTLRQVNEATLPPDHPGQVPHAPTSSLRTKAAMVTAADGTGDSGATIDVLVVYSQQTATTAGAGIGAQIQQVIDTANVVYANSGIATRLRLVGKQAMPYSESGNFSTDLSNLTSGVGGLSGVGALRDSTKADLVSLFVEGMQYCGLAWVGPSANFGYSVVNRNCALTNLSFVHEVGHNFGALHDPYADGSNAPYTFGHGYVYAGQKWRTVMATGDACVSVGGCARINFFSNPNLNFGAPPVPLGTAAQSDNARVHNQNAYTVANFRNSGAGGCSFSVPAGADVAAAGTNGSFAVTGTPGCTWNASSEASWLKISAATGTGSGTLTYTVDPNPTATARGANIVIGAAKFGVYQFEGCTYTLSTSAGSMAAAGGNGAFTLTTAGTGCTWNAASSATWLGVTPASGTGSATISYTVAANTATTTRSANLTVGGKTFMLTQSAATPPAPACTFTVSPASVSVLAGAQSGTLNVTGAAGCVWNAKSDSSWITITAATGSGSGTLKYAIAANAGAARNGHLTINGVAVDVNQGSGCSFTLAATNVSFPSEGGSGSVKMTVNNSCSWTSTSNAAWLVANTSSGAGSATISYTAQANSGAARTAQLNIGGRVYTVSQAAPQAASASYSTQTLTLPQTKVGTTSAVSTSTLTNPGDLPLTIKSLNGSGLISEFIRGGTCAASGVVAGHSTCTITYAFKPSAVGTRSMSLQVVTSANSVSLTVRGQGTK